MRERFVDRVAQRGIHEVLAARRAELVRAAGWDADHWTRVDRGFRALLTAEASQGALRAAVPIADRFPLLLRYGALYAAAKKGAIAEVAAPEPAAPPAAAPPEAAAGPTSGAPTSAVDASNQAAQQG